MLFYFVRHGQTLSNLKRIMAGAGIDSPLTDEGHRQAEALASIFNERTTQPARRLIVSSLKRAQQTGEYLSRALGLALETSHDLREWHLGDWEGQHYETCVPLMLSGGEPPKGETRSTFYGRIESAWRAVHSDDDPYVLVSHGAVWMALQDILEIPRFKVGNCQLIRVTRFKGVWRAEVIG